MRDRWRCYLCKMHKQTDFVEILCITKKTQAGFNSETAVHYPDTTTKNAINYLIKVDRFHQNSERQTTAIGIDVEDCS